MSEIYGFRQLLQVHIVHVQILSLQAFETNMQQQVELIQAYLRL